MAGDLKLPVGPLKSAGGMVASAVGMEASMAGDLKLSVGPLKSAGGMVASPVGMGASMAGDLKLPLGPLRSAVGTEASTVGMEESTSGFSPLRPTAAAPAPKTAPAPARPAVGRLADNWSVEALGAAQAVPRVFPRTEHLCLRVASWHVVKLGSR
jgi:hypothetical protein